MEHRFYLNKVQALPLRIFGSKLVRDTKHRMQLGKQIRDDMWDFGKDRLGMVSNGNRIF